MKGTTQENISNEVKELVAKKYGVDDTISFQVCFQLQMQSFVHVHVAYLCSRVQHACFCSIRRTLGLCGDVWSKEKEHQCDLPDLFDLERTASQLD